MNRHQQLAAQALCERAGRRPRLDLRGTARECIVQLDDAPLVLVAQWPVNVALKRPFDQHLLLGAQRLSGRAKGLGWHAQKVPRQAL